MLHISPESAKVLAGFVGSTADEATLQQLLRQLQGLRRGLDHARNLISPALQPAVLFHPDRWSSDEG